MDLPRRVARATRKRQCMGPVLARSRIDSEAPRCVARANRKCQDRDRVSVHSWVAMEVPRTTTSGDNIGPGLHSLSAPASAREASGLYTPSLFTSQRSSFYRGSPKKIQKTAPGGLVVGGSSARPSGVSKIPKAREHPIAIYRRLTFSFWIFRSLVLVSPPRPPL